MKLHQDCYPVSLANLLFLVLNVGPEILLSIRLSTRSLYQEGLRLVILLVN